VYPRIARPKYAILAASTCCFDDGSEHWQSQARAAALLVPDDALACPSILSRASCDAKLLLACLVVVPVLRCPRSASVIRGPVLWLAIQLSKSTGSSHLMRGGMSSCPKASFQFWWATSGQVDQVLIYPFDIGLAWAQFARAPD
jgi:hypothetical protein